jgi:uncharacterized membrane protein
MSPRTLTRTALFIALTAAGTLAVRIPNPATQGYINLGDTLIMTGALVFGWRAGGLAGGMGSALADFLGGYALWAPWSLVIKGVEGAVTGALGAWSQRRPAGWPRRALHTLAPVIGGGWMVAGYYLAGAVLFGAAAALTEVPGNLVQAGVGAALALPLSAALKRLLRRGTYESHPS